MTIRAIDDNSHTGNEMRSFHDSKELKQEYVDRVEHHQAADEITQGTYWENGKGCAVGCTIHSDDHHNYEVALGLPEWLAHLEDRLFEGMSNVDAKAFPLIFLEAINVGSNLTSVKSKFLAVVLEFSLKQFDNNKNLNCTKAIKGVIHFYKTGEGNLTELRKFAADAADAAAYGYGYDSHDDDVAAAYAAAYAAADASHDNDVADAADDAADAADAVSPRQVVYKYFADQLIDILKETV